MAQDGIPPKTAKVNQAELLAAASEAMSRAYAPYSTFKVGAALGFADGRIITGANVENASYGLSLCAETVAVAAAMNAGIRSGLVALAICSDPATPTPVTPCGRCRQVLYELASLGESDPVIWCSGNGVVWERQLSALLPDAFGPKALS